MTILKANEEGCQLEITNLPASQPAGQAAPKFLRLLVESSAGDAVDLPLRLPLSLIRENVQAGMKILDFLPPVARDKVEDALSEQGIELDLKNLRPEDLEDLITAIGALNLQVQSDTGDKVRIFCE